MEICFDSDCDCDSDNDCDRNIFLENTYFYIFFGNYIMELNPHYTIQDKSHVHNIPSWLVIPNTAMSI